MDELPPPRGRCHPFEEIDETLKLDDGQPAHMTDAEAARTIVEVRPPRSRALASCSLPRVLLPLHAARDAKRYSI
jgi:hypothetical protein